MRPIIIIPAISDSAMLGECVASIRHSAPSLLDDTIVVLDGGTADAAADIARRHGVIAVTTSRQQGFAAACNHGARHSIAHAGATEARELGLLFLNDDARLPEGWVEDVQRLDDEIGAISFDVHGPRGNRKRYPGVQRGDLWLHAGPTLSGCAFAVRADRYRELGGMDEGFVMYGEETDLFSRLLGQGLLLAQSDKVVWHHGEGSMGSRKLRATWYGIRNPLRHDILNSSPRTLTRTAGATLADTLTPRQLSRRHEAHADRRRHAPYVVRAAMLPAALLSLAVELPSLLRKRSRRRR